MKNVQLIMLRHGQSQWNQENRFTGWVDVDLSTQGINEAQQAGRRMREEGMRFDIAYTSYLKRAIKTLWWALEYSERFWIPVVPAWELNERHYGALTGLNKTDTAAQYGEAQVKIWRRSYTTRPPQLAENDNSNPAYDSRYQHLEAQDRPCGESLADTVVRVARYFETWISPQLHQGRHVLVVAHGNSLRALVKYLEKMSEAEVLELNIPTGVPLCYTLAADSTAWNIVDKRYLGNPTT